MLNVACSRGVLGIFLLGLLTACTFPGLNDPQVASPTPAAPMTDTAIIPVTAQPATGTPQLTPPARPSDAPRPTDTPAQAGGVTETPGPVLGETGPWLVFNTTQGLGMVSPLGGAAIPLHTRLAQPAIMAASPAGRWLAYQVAEEQGFPPADIALGLISLPEGFDNRLEPLLSTGLQDQLRASSGSAARPPEAALALTQPGRLAWSPDGRWLAFVAASEGSDADVYLYDQSTGQRQRLTAEPGQAARLTWSPDGAWLVYLAAETFGTGAGWGGTAVWVTTPAGGVPRQLFTVASGGPLEVLGWIAPDTFVAHDRLGGASTALRSINVATGVTSDLYLGAFSAAALDPTTGTTALVLGSSAGGPAGAGVYLLPPGGQPQLVEPGTSEAVTWSPEMGRFAVIGPEALLTFSPLGTAVTFVDERWVAVSPDGVMLAFWETSEFGDHPGLRLFAQDGALIREVTAESVEAATWAPDGSSLVYVSNRRLYAATPSGESSRLLAEGVEASPAEGLAWLEPEF